MKTRALLIALALVACKKDEAKPAPPAMPAACASYVKLLGDLRNGPPPGFPDQAVVKSQRALPVVGGSRPIPASDVDVLGDGVELQAHVDEAVMDRSGEQAALQQMPPPDHAADQPPPDRDAGAGAKRVPYRYVLADATTPIADLRALRAMLGYVGELRLVVKKTPAERVAQHLAMFPKTPKAWQDKLPTLDGAASLVQLLEMGKGCPGVDDNIDMARQGGPIDAVGPAIAETLDRCKCKVTDLDGFVSLLGWIALPLIDAGYLPIDLDVADTQPDGSTVGDLAKAIAS